MRNTKYRIAVCDDEAEQAQYISGLVKAFCDRSGIAYEIRTFSSAEQYLFEYGDGIPDDILLLDVSMSGQSGIDLAKRLRRDGCRTEIIFITSHFEFCGEGYDVDALHYLIKPVSQDKLSCALQKAYERISDRGKSILISCEDQAIKLYVRDILYVEACLHYITIHTALNEYRIKESISAFEKKLGEGFYRVHRSYIVSLTSITKITRNFAFIHNGHKVPIARGKYDGVIRAFIDISRSDYEKENLS